MYKLAVVGSRTFDDYFHVSQRLDPLKSKISAIVSGGADGADSLAERWAKENDIEVIIFKPNWDQYGKSAGYIRNKKIISECDACMAFWDGESKGTQHSFKLCREMDKPLKIIGYKTDPPF